MPEQEITIKQHIPKEGERRLSLGEHYDAIVSIYAAANNESLEDAKMYVDESTVWWVAALVAVDKNGKVLGAGLLSDSFDEEEGVFELCGAYVVPEARRGGIWKQMLEERIRIAKEMKATAVVMLTKPEAPHANHLPKVGFVQETPIDDTVWQFRRTL